MSIDDHKTPPSRVSRRVTAPAWIALAIAVALAFAGAIVLVHKPQVPAVVPGHKAVTSVATS
jgi:hypothetical protein